jgi:acetylglutamate kinase
MMKISLVCWSFCSVAAFLYAPALRGPGPNAARLGGRQRSTPRAAAASPDMYSGEILSECLAELTQHAGKTIVVKYGGHAMSDATAAALFARDVVLLQRVGIRVVIVHGGGPQIAKMLERLEIESSFVDGLRVTDAATVEVAEMVLCGSINKGIASAINQAGGHALGLSGKDDSLVVATKAFRSTNDPVSGAATTVDLGFVGEPSEVNVGVLESLLDAGFMPVIAPIGVGTDGQTYNINADTVAGAVAGALDASRLLLLTDVKGVLDDGGKLMPNLSPSTVRGLLESGVIKGGMIPKIQTATTAVGDGVEAVVIVDGRRPHAVLLELFSVSGAGTMVRSDAASA